MSLIEKLNYLGIKTINHKSISTHVDTYILLENDYDIEINYHNITTKNYDYYNNLLDEPHTILLYKEMMMYYLGLGGLIFGDKSISSDISSNYGTDNNGTKCINTIKYENINKEINIPSFKCTYLFSTDCWFKGCHINKKIYFFEYNDILIIFFNIGRVLIDFPIKIDEMYNWYNSNIVYSTLNNQKYKKIFLMGHSNGMTCATTTAFIFMFADKTIVHESDFSEYFADSEDLKLFDNKCFKNIKNITNKIAICGTGGFPSLFINENGFKEYYNYYKGRYIHISSGLNISDSSEIFSEKKKFFFKDIYMNDKENDQYEIIHKNYKYYIYYKDSYDVRQIESDSNSCYYGLMLNSKLIQNYIHSNIIYTNYIPKLIITDIVHKFKFYRTLLKLYFI